MSFTSVPSSPVLREEIDRVNESALPRHDAQQNGCGNSSSVHSETALQSFAETTINFLLVSDDLKNECKL